MAAQNADVASFCFSCGSPAHPRGGVRQGPRRTVTVLFVDIVGFTSLIDDLDCEDVRALQRDYFATVSAVVRVGGGVVEKYVGDAVMAVFDAPDRAELAGARAELAGARVEPAGARAGRAAARAVRAGIAVQQVLRGHLLAGRFAVATRVGIATGEAIVDCAAIRDGGQAMLSGKVVSTAARLQAYAPHDTVVVCGATRRLTDDSVAYQDLPPAVVPGRRQPLELWRALHSVGRDAPDRRTLLGAARH